MKFEPKVLVTGAGGFIGSHLTESLVRDGYSVKALVSYSSSGSYGWLDELSKEMLSNIEIVRGDIRDGHQMSDLVKGIESVLHLAALIAIPYSYSAPGSYVRTNIEGTLNLLQAARMHEVKSFIHTSTSEVYGTAQFAPITEQHPLVGQSPYSASKIGADQLASSFYNSFNLPVKILRPFNTYGPRQSARALIPSTIIQALSGRKEINLGSLTPTRDFSYISDTVAGFRAALSSEKAVGETINLGSGFEISVRETVDLIATLTGRELEIKQDDERIRPEKSEVERLVSDNAKARRLLDWQPNHANLEGLKEGLTKTIEWFQFHEEHFKNEIYNK